MSDQPKPPCEQQEILESLSTMDIEQWIEMLQRADRSFYNMMALEVWSIAKTMDTLLPGFWSQFMHNRQVALKKFLEEKQAQRNSNSEVTAPQK